jgi:hypothetical protein
MRQKSGFDWYPEFKTKEIEFEVGDKYLFRQLTDLLIRAAFDGGQLTREIILLRSPATAPEKELLVWLMW